MRGFHPPSKMRFLRFRLHNIRGQILLKDIVHGKLLLILLYLRREGRKLLERRSGRPAPWTPTRPPRPRCPTALNCRRVFQGHLGRSAAVKLNGCKFILPLKMQIFYTLGCLLTRDVLLCFLSEAPVTNEAAK